MMKKADLMEYLDFWNQVDKGDGQSKPINPYQFGAYFLDPRFYLKWYLNKDAYEALAQELNYEFEPGQEHKISFQYGDQNVEIELTPTA